MERRIENFQHYEGKVCKTEKQNVPYDTGTNTDKKENVGFWETNSRSLKECHFKGKKKEEKMSPFTNHVKHPLVEGRCSLNSQET